MTRRLGRLGLSWLILALAGCSNLDIIDEDVVVDVASEPPETDTHVATVDVVVEETAPPADTQAQDTQVPLDLTITSVSPAQGSARGGETVMVEGTGFPAGALVRFGETLAPSVTVVSDTKLKVVTPVMVAGVLDVSVGVANAGEVVAEGAFLALPLELRFVDVPEYSFPGYPELDVRAAAAADLDNDGDTDLILAPEGALPLVLGNDGNGNFADTDPPPEPEPDPDPGADAGSTADATADATSDAGAADAGAQADAGADVEAPPSAPPLAGVRDAVTAELTGDGCVDLLVSTSTGARLFAGDCAGHLTDVTESMLPDDPGDFGGVVAADADGDGRTDLLLADRTPDAGDAAQTRLYTRATDTAPYVRADHGRLPPHAEATATLALFDADGNGEPDLVLGNLEGGDGVFLRLLLQFQGNFVDAPPGMLVPPGGPVTHLAAGDVDGDSDTDLLVVCPGAQDRLYLNDGHGFFFDDTALSMPVDLSNGTRAVLADLDLDGDQDAVITNDPQQNRLYLDNGKGRYLDYTPLFPIVQDPARGVLLVDVEGDGDLDVVFVEGAGVPNRLLLSVKPEVL